MPAWRGPCTARLRLTVTSASLLAQERLLAADTPSVAPRPTARRHDAMAGNGERDRIRRARPCDGPRGARAADGRGDLRVRTRLAVRDRGQRIPDLPLKRRGLHVERQIEPRPTTVEVGENLSGPTSERRLDPVSRWPQGTLLSGGARDRGRTHPSTPRRHLETSRRRATVQAASPTIA